MAERQARSDVLKKLSDGKTLCSEMNNASSNAHFLFMRRHDALVLQLESAKQSLVSQNQRAQNEMRKNLDKLKQRKRVILRNRLVNRQTEETEESESAPSLRPATSATGCSSIGNRSSLSLTSGCSSIHFPSILSMSLLNNSDNPFHSNINRHQKFHRMKRQESMHFQVLSSRVYDFCAMLDSERCRTDPFFITSKRRIAFNESRPKSRASSTSGSRVASSNASHRGKLFRERHIRFPTAVAT